MRFLNIAARLSFAALLIAIAAGLVAGVGVGVLGAGAGDGV